MKSIRAVAILVVPFALMSMVLLGAMCLTPYWECKVMAPFSSVWLAPAVFTFLVFLVGAAIVLSVDLILLATLPRGKWRTTLLTSMGSVIAVLPWLVLRFLGGQGIGALNPQLEYLPLLISGALFAFLLDRMVGSYP